MSYTLHVSVSDTLYETLSKTARQTGQPLETVVTQWLAIAAEHVAHDPLDSFIGALNSGGMDWANNHDHYLGQPDNNDKTNDIV